MSLMALSANSEYSGGYRGLERRAAPETASAAEAAIPPLAAPASPPLEFAYYASRFKADLTRIKPPSGATESEPAQTSSDPDLFDFFGNLGVLLVAVRSGDLSRAQSAADALEMDVLVERSASRGGEAPILADFGRLFGAAHSRDEAGARAAARQLANELRHALAIPEGRTPPEPYPELTPQGACAYETLAHYSDAEPTTV